MDENGIKEAVRKRYARIAKDAGSCCSSCNTCGTCESDVSEQAKRIGYSEEELKNIPKDSVMGLGCGNPTALADVKEGETVLDLGAGAGIDVFLAANKVGKGGRVIGVDMTEDMVKKANAAASKGGYTNVEFRLGEIESLPVEDGSVDLVISNCVINLSTDKLRTYQEAYRVMRPGGRIVVSDIVIEGKLPESVRKSIDAWSKCIAGALEKDEYIGTIRKAGFKDIIILSQAAFHNNGKDLDGAAAGKAMSGKVVSIKVKAYK